jgi:hypothetical protein
LFVEHTSPRVFEFDNLIRLTINQDGAWKITDAMCRDYFPSDWAEVCVGRTIDIGYTAINIKTKDGDSDRAMLARQTADNLLALQWWGSDRPYMDYYHDLTVMLQRWH